MANPEHSFREPQKESAQPAYYRAARYAEDADSSRAYARVERTLHRNRQLDLSVFRVILESQWLLVILGVTPPEPFETHLQHLLLPGELVTVRPDVLAILHQRREASRGLGRWVERHFRPGQPL